MMHYVVRTIDAHGDAVDNEFWSTKAAAVAYANHLSDKDASWHGFVVERRKRTADGGIDHETVATCGNADALAAGGWIAAIAK